MTRSPLIPLLAGTALALISASRAALADDCDEDPCNDLVTVAIRAPDGFSFDVGALERHGVRRHIARCDNRCVVHVPRGTLEVHLYDRDGALDGTQSFDIDAASHVVIEPSSTGLAGVGLLAGFAGSAAFLVGSLPCVFSSMAEPADGAKGGQVGCSAMFIGMIAAPMGFVLYGRTRSPSVDVSPLQPSRVRAAFAPSSGGGMLSVRVDF